jgi:hypothetical protein
MSDVPIIGTKPEGESSMNQVAPDGQVFVCMACGKMSKDRYGMQRISSGWDESCMLNAILCYRNKLVMQTANSVRSIDEGGIVKEELQP